MTVNVYLPRRALPVIDEAARQMGIARSAWIRLAIIEKLRRDGEPDWGLVRASTGVHRGFNRSPPQGQRMKP